MKQQILDFSGKRSSEIIKIPRAMAQGTYNISEKDKIAIVKNGKICYLNPTTINDEKIADTCIQIFQNSKLAEEMDYKRLRELAITSLEDRFEKYNIITDEEIVGRTVAYKNSEKKEIAIHQWIREHIEANYDTTFSVDFDRFMGMTGIKSASRVGNALNILRDVQSKAFYEYQVPTISEDFSTKEYRYVRVLALPKIEIVLDEEAGEKYPILDDFIRADIKNKKKHIKGITFRIDNSYLSAIMALGRDFTLTNRQVRNNFKRAYSFKLDNFLSSIMEAQHTELNKVTFEELQKKIGTNFADYRYFKKNVLLPSLEDVNNFSGYSAELIETRKGRKIDYLSFSIKSKKASRDLKFGIEKVVYYIASRIYYFSKDKIKNLIGFAKDLEKTIDTIQGLYKGKEIDEWKKEAEKEFKVEEELIKFIDQNKRIFDYSNIIYDEKRMCLVEKTIVHKDTFIAEHPDLPNEMVEYEGKGVEKIKLLKTRDFSVTNPSSSLRYIHEVLLKELPKEEGVYDYLPFYYSTSKGSVYIDRNIEDYLKYKDGILYDIAEKNAHKFKFEPDHLKKDLFYTKLLDGDFPDITSSLREAIKQIHTPSLFR